MGLVTIKCPNCGGSVEMDDTLISGFCNYCGHKIMNDKAIIGNVTVKVDRSDEVVNQLKNAKYALYDKNGGTARKCMESVMAIDSENSDVWYLKAILDDNNRVRCIARAQEYSSYGIFIEKDVNAYKDYDKKDNTLMLLAPLFLILMGAIVFGVLGATVFNWGLIALAIPSGAFLLIILFMIYWLKMKNNMPKPVFYEDQATKERGKTYGNVRTMANENAIEDLASKGDAKAQYAMGMDYFMGTDGCQQSFEKAFQWWMKAALQDDPDSCYQIAVAYEKGIGVEANVDNALMWYKRAANLGIVDAANAIIRIKNEGY